MPSDKIDLNELADKPDHQLTIKPREDPAERDSRLRIEEANAAHQLKKDFALNILACVVILVALGLCVWSIVRASSTEEDRRWAVTLLTAIVSALLGYVTGKSSK